MFKVKTYLGQSSIHGIGVFLGEPVKKGQLVWQFDKDFDMQITQKHLDALYPVQYDYFSTYCYKSIKTGFYVFCIDDAKYVNHSVTPSTTGIYPPHCLHVEGADVAARDLAVGEEITSDYLLFDSRRLPWLIAE